MAAINYAAVDGSMETAIRLDTPRARAHTQHTYVYNIVLRYVYIPHVIYV